MLPVHTCTFVLASNLFAGYEDILDELSEADTFTWGDANHTLISVQRLKATLECIYESVDADSLPKFFELLEELEKDGVHYVDFEN